MESISLEAASMGVVKKHIAHGVLWSQAGRDPATLSPRAKRQCGPLKWDTCQAVKSWVSNGACYDLAR